MSKCTCGFDVRNAKDHAPFCERSVSYLKPKIFTSAEVQALLEKQREACANSMVEAFRVAPSNYKPELHEDDLLIRAILNATIETDKAEPKQYNNPSCFGKRLNVEACNHGCPVSNECYSDK